MASTRSLRRSVPFDPRFVERHPLFWPLRRAAAVFAARSDWPDVAAWGAVFAGAPPITFRVAAPRGRRPGRAPRPADARYDAMIVERGVVPSRPRHWHDFANALVWGTFPRAKLALHRRQRGLIAARLGAALSPLPPHRSREQDGLAMIDEGGVVALATPDAELRLVFGHALYEGFVLGVRGMTARMVRLAVAALGPDPIAEADAALAAALAGDELSTRPESLPRVFVPDVPAAPWLPPGDDQ